MYGLIYHELGHVYHKQYGLFNQYSDDNKQNFVWQFQQILIDFNADLPMMTRFNQKYFGDWVNYCGQGDVGYYLGTKLVQHLCNKYCFEQLINMKIDDVYKLYLAFAEAQQ